MANIKNKAMTQEQKARAYDEAVKRAKKEKEKSRNLGLLEFIEDTFPELKESEDERIRDEIVLYIGAKDDISLDTHNKWLSWLEKQGQSRQVSIWKHWKDGIAGNGEGKPIYLVKIGNTYSLKSCLGFECDYIELSELDNLMLEKQNKQTPDNKVEVKFKVGDWVVTSYGKVNQIIAVDEDNDGFTLDDDTYFSGSWKDSYHLWTIQDAKDGDVLAFYGEYRGNKMEQVGIIKEYVGKHGGCSNSFKIYVGVNWESHLQIDKYMGCSDIRPATKEQRELLFKRMHEAGYEWNADKKELKKINSYCQEHCKGYQETGKCFVDGGCNAKREAEKIENTSPLLSDFFNAEYERGKADALKCAEWSEEDEQYLLVCKNALAKYQTTDKWDAGIISHWLEDRLKSLKERYTWKPSEEQMEALKTSFLYWKGTTKEIPYAERLESLYEQLKKLTE